MDILTVLQNDAPYYRGPVNSESENPVIAKISWEYQEHPFMFPTWFYQWEPDIYYAEISHE